MLDHIFINLPTLETKRLVLRKLLYTDQEDIFEYAKKPTVAEHVLWEPHKTEFDTIQFLNLVYESYNHNQAAPWGITVKKVDKVIGTVGFVNWNREDNIAEIGYALDEKYWNQGFVTEAVFKVINFGFEKLKLHKIISRCKPQNVGSFRVLEKCGFNFDGLVENQMQIKGRWEDMKLYSFTTPSPNRK